MAGEAMAAEASTDERNRLDDIRWREWGPYLSERAWGTVREDYSGDGSAWFYFPHDHARSRAYRWNEDGLMGICDRRQYLCFALALWNGRDPILKERLFGLTGPEGNHGEDVKEYYFYQDSTPSHRYMSMLYKYPQAAFPYEQLLDENRRRGYHDTEFELLDTGIFDDTRYFDVQIEYAKAAPDDIVMRIHVTNRGPDPATCTVLPTLWFRNTWTWGYERGPMADVAEAPVLESQNGAILARHPVLGDYMLHADHAGEALFTGNETNCERLYGTSNPSPYVKDAFHRYVIDGDTSAVNPARTGTKAAFLYQLDINAGATATIDLRLRKADASSSDAVEPFADADAVLSACRAEADAFYEALHGDLGEDERAVQRQTLAGMLWSKQLYYFDVEQWLAGDPVFPAPEQRRAGRNREWLHLNNHDVISMPDKWEYPWYAGWDLGFHAVALALVDPPFAKDQLLLLTREWYMHPNGQLPAYEWAYGDVNPPVHAWAAWKVYTLDGSRDLTFLKRIFHKLLLNFTWWVNRKDAEGRNIFQGGFLGLDNISLFDRSTALPTGGTIDQSDGTAWMGFYTLTMMRMSIELARHDRSYEDMAIKFYEHFLWIALAISGDAHGGVGLWDDADGFFYDVLRLPDGQTHPLKVRSLVGLMPLIAVETVGRETLDELKGFARSIQWLSRHRPDLAANLARSDRPGHGQAHLFAMSREDRLRGVLRYMLDEDEFLSPFGIRSLSKVHERQPYTLEFGGDRFMIDYQPGESLSGLFGGNSNWRGPIWFPINYLLIEALQRYYRYYGDDFTVECPTGSGNFMTLKQVSDELMRRMARLFLRDEQGRRPIYGDSAVFQSDPHWRDHILFHEYFHGDTGVGLGASHQTGWTGLIALMLQEMRQLPEGASSP